MMGADMGAENMEAENQEQVMASDSGKQDQADFQDKGNISISGIPATDMMGEGKMGFFSKGGVGKRGSDPTVVNAFFDELEKQQHK
jgi:hypothetical protein